MASINAGKNPNQRREQEMSEDDKQANQKIIQSMNKRVNFLKNPRFTEGKRPLLYSDLTTRQELIDSPNSNKSFFRAYPQQIVFRDYVVGQIYELDLCLTNISYTLKRIKYMPPSKLISYFNNNNRLEFAIGSISYPSQNDGNIAPGMSVYMKIRFNPSSIAEFDDELAIITEENIFKIPLLARKDPPRLDLPQSLDCKSCWLGDQIDVRFKVTNVGGEAGYKFYQSNEDDQIYDSLIKVGNFIVSPSEFYLEKNQFQEIQVIFKPNQEGESFETLVLRCDDQTSQTIKVVGKGNTVELSIAALDGKSLKQTEQLENVVSEPLQKIFFNNAIPNQTSSRSLQIQNRTSVQVKYYWKLFKKEQKDDEQPFFQITPSEGHFLPDEEIEFMISLQSPLYIPLFEYANLIINEIPMEAIRNPSEGLKNQCVQEVGSKSIRPSITYFEFELITFQSLSQVIIEPPFYVFPTSLNITEIHKKSFQIINTSLCHMQYEVCVELLSSDQMMTHIGQSTGLLGPNQEMQLELGIGSETIGVYQKVIYRIDFDYCNSVSIEIIAHFQAPIIKVQEPMVNFGLIKTNTLKSFGITLQNLTSIKALVDISCESQGSKLQFIPDQFEILPDSEQKCEIQFQAFDSETYRDFLIIQVRGGLAIILEVFAEVQSPKVSLNRVLLEIECLYSGNTYSFDERSQHNIIIQNLGNIPTPFEWEIPADLSKFMVQFDPVSGVVPPKTNLPIKFSIKPSQGGRLEQIFICDVKGLEFPLGFELITKVLGLSVEYELLDEVQVAHFCRDIGTAHSSSQNSSKKSPASNQRKQFKQGTMLKTNVSSKSSKSRRTQIDMENEENDIVPEAVKLEKIDFFGCIISQPKQMKFMIRNTSGIQTQYRFYMETYEANEDDVQFTDDYEGSKSAQTKSIRFAATDGQSKLDGKSQNSRSIIKKGKITQEGKPTILLTDRIEKTKNFTSVDGQKLNHQKKLENDQRIYLSNNLGLAIVCEPNKGNLLAYGSILVTVTCFNDICGLFDDNLCIDVRGLEITKFPVTVEVKGSPVVITQNQLGINYGGEIPFFDIGAYMRNSGMISRELRVTNTGPKDVELEWKCYNLGGQSKEQKYFDIKIVDPPLGSEKVCQIQFIAIEPEEAIEGPFYISPKLERVRGRREKHFTINFQTGDTGIYNAVLVAKPRLFETSEQGQPVGSINLYLRAETLQPTLYIDKLPRDGDAHKIKFQQWTNGFNKRQEKRLCLVNKQKSGFVCSVELEGPFTFLATSSSSPQKYELQSAQTLRDGPQKTFNLVQNSHIELVIKFDGPQNNNLQEWPMNYKVYKTGLLNMFFANGDQQKIHLEGILLRPYVHLNTSGIDNVEGPETLEFGVVHINNKKTLQFHLSNLSAVPASWKLNYIKYPMKKNLVEQTMTLLDKEDQAKTDDQSVFEFQVAEGTLQGPSTMVHTLPHASALPHKITLKEIHNLGIEPHKIQVNFRPKKNILYKSKYRISVQDGPSVEFILKGTGTYDEKLEKTYD